MYVTMSPQWHQKLRRGSINYYKDNSVKARVPEKSNGTLGTNVIRTTTYQGKHEDQIDETKIVGETRSLLLRAHR